VNIHQILSRHVIYRILIQGLSAFSAILASSILGETAYGQISYFILNASLLTIVCSLGVDAAIIYWLNQQKISTKYVWKLTTHFALVLVIVLPVLEYFLNLYGKSLFSNAPNLIYTLAGIIYVICNVCGSFLLAVLSAKLLFKISNLVWIGANSFVFIGYLFFKIGIFHSLTAEKAIIILGISQLIFVLLSYLVYRGILTTSDNAERKVPFRELMSYSLVLFFSNLVQFLVYRLDFWILDYTHGEGALGVFALFNQWIQLIWFIPRNIAVVFYSFSSSDSDQAFKQLTFYIKLVFWGTILGAAPAMVIVWGLLQWHDMASFASYYKVFAILYISEPLFCTAILIAAYLSATGKVSINMKFSLISLFISLVASIALIPRWGIYGAGVEELFVYSMQGIFFLIYFSRRYNTPITKCLLINKDEFVRLKSLFKRWIKF
jgi:O-antigen/teichoic acid export membrane protein